MNDFQVIRFSYQQSLAWKDGPGTRWSETIEASVTLLDYALSSGWLRENFTGRRGGANDFLVLLAIVMHARPLDEPDLSYLVRLKLACPEDAGRLYARVTDLGLADELGMDRSTIAASTKRLAGMRFITIAEIPENLGQFRDSHGRFEGAKIYLLAGDLQERLMPKRLVPRTAHRAGLTDTVRDDPERDRAALSSTVGDQTPSTVLDEPAYRAGSSDINIDDDEEEEVFKAGRKNDTDPLFHSQIQARFIELHGSDYAVTARDKKAILGLFQDGYSTAEILAGMERAAANLGGSLKQARSLAYCAPEIRRLASVSRRQSGPDQSKGNDISEKPTSADAPEDLTTGSVPEHVLTVFAQAAGRVPTPAERNRLFWLFEEFGPAIQERQGDAWEWISEALKKSPADTRHPVAYVRVVLSRRLASPAPLPAKSIQAKDSPANAAQPEEKPPSALAAVPGDEAAILVGGLRIEKPKPRRSGYVIPGELAMGYLYNFAVRQGLIAEDDQRGE